MARLIFTDRLWRTGSLIRMGYLQHEAETPWRLMIASDWLRAVLSTIFWTVLGYVAAGPEGGRFAFVGAVAMSMTLGMVAMTDVPLTEKWSGTFYRLQSAVVSPGWTFLLRGIATLTSSLVMMLTCFAVSGLVTGNLALLIDLLPALPLYGLIGLSLACAGLTAGAFVVGKRAEVAIYNALMYLVIACSGAFVPAGTVPLLDVIGSVLPSTHGIAAIRSYLDGGPWLGQATLEVIVALCWLMVAYAIFARQTVRARKYGFDAFS